MSSTVLETSLADLPVRRGKVRDIYDLGDQLLLVSTDRISAFDWVLPTGIPDKGRVLTQLSRVLVRPARRAATTCSRATSSEFDLPAGIDRAPLAGRSMLVRKTEVVPIECVVRGYLSGSGWKEYQQTRHGLRHRAAGRAARERPAARADLHAGDQGRHRRARREHLVRRDVPARRHASWPRSCAAAASTSTRAAPTYAQQPRHHHRRHEVRVRPGRRRADPDRRSADARQLAVLAGRRVRSRAAASRRSTSSSSATGSTTSGWDKNSPPPALPPDVVAKTRAKYIEAFERI